MSALTIHIEMPDREKSLALAAALFEQFKEDGGSVRLYAGHGAAALAALKHPTADVVIVAQPSRN